MTFTRKGLFNKINPKIKSSDLQKMDVEEFKGYLRWYQVQVENKIREFMAEIGYKAAVISDTDSYMEALRLFKKNPSEVQLEILQKLQFETHIYDDNQKVVMKFATIPLNNEELKEKVSKDLLYEFLTEEEREILMSLIKD